MPTETPLVQPGQSAFPTPAKAAGDFSPTPAAQGGASPSPTPTATQPAQPQYTVQQMANAVRQKFPGAYDKVDDQKLVDAWTTKYPVYKPQLKPTTTSNPIAETANNYGANIKGAIDHVTELGKNAYDVGADPKSTVIDKAKAVGEMGLGTAAAGVQAIFAPLSAPVQTLLNHIASRNADLAASGNPDKANPFMGPDGKMTPEAQAAHEQLSSWAQQHPELSRTLADAFTVGTAAVGAGAEGEGLNASVSDTASALASKAKGVTNSIKTAVVGTPEEQAAAQAVKASADTTAQTAKVSDLYNRAIRPTVTGKATAAQTEQASSRVVSGLKAIHDNKANLSFTNTDGETVTNAAPKTVDQLSQAISQTKASIFKQYDALAKQAGEAGVTVDTPTIAKELDPVIKSKSLALANPQAVEYAKTVQARYMSAGKITAQDAQDVIQHYNDSLKAFYRNPSYDTASKAGIDALIANKLRDALDKGISGATGEQYQALKNQYGALSSMEKDVAHRNVVWGRQNKVGLATNLGNVASGAELVRGLLTMNPTDIAVSLGIKGIQQYAKYLNNPDVGVSKIFSQIEKSGRPAIGNTPAPEATGIK